MCHPGKITRILQSKHYQEHLPGLPHWAYETPWLKSSFISRSFLLFRLVWLWPYSQYPCSLHQIENLCSAAILVVILNASQPAQWKFQNLTVPASAPECHTCKFQRLNCTASEKLRRLNYVPDLFWCFIWIKLEHQG